MLLLPMARGQQISQSTGIFKGSISLFGNPYVAEYDYLIVGKDTLMNGRMRLDAPMKKIEESNSFKYQNLIGNYLLGYPSGVWEYKFGTLKPAGKGFYRDYNYSYKVSGDEFFTTGVLSNGAVSGSWKTLHLKIDDSKIKDTLFYTQVTFPNDSLLGGFSVAKDGYFMSGSVDSIGFPSGSWQYFKRDQKIGHTLLYELVFKDNFLEKIRSYHEGVIDSIIVSNIGANSAVVEDKTISEKYFDIIHLIASTQDSSFDENCILKPARLFLEALEHNQAADKVLADFIKSKISPIYNIKILKFPYDSIEVQQLDQLKNKYNKLRTLLNQISNDPQVVLTKQSTSAVSRLVSVVDTLESMFLKDLNHFLDLSKSGALEYVSRDEYIVSNLAVLNSVKFNPELKSQNDWKDYSFQYSAKGLELLNLLGLISYCEELIGEVKYIRQELDKFIFEIEKEERLSALEELMVSRYEATKLYIDSILSFEVDIIAGFDVRSMLKQFVDSELNSYSKSTSIEVKMTQIEPLLNCFDNVQDIARTMSYVPANKDVIQEAYTREVFNPYTFTNMEETVKQPIYKSFNQVILPGLFGNLSSLSCDNLKDLDKNFDKAFEGMIQLLERDTRRLERRIRRISEPAKAAELLNFDLTFN